MNPYAGKKDSKKDYSSPVLSRSKIKEKPMPQKIMTENFLKQVHSPYLRRAKEKKVKWQIWQESVFQQAIDQDKPILVCIGYSACHWCHKMDEDCFENEHIADYLNTFYICIRVDKEERPDLDQLYSSCSLILQRGEGGWPLNLFLNHEKKPFHACSYLPPNHQTDESFFPLIRSLHQDWQQKRHVLNHEADETCSKLHDLYSKNYEGFSSTHMLFLLPDEIYKRFDPKHGGFSNKPKFYSYCILDYLLAFQKVKKNKDVDKMLKTTLNSMLEGAVFDLVGGGFFRYATDQQWQEPHFEKMLYDNALLLEIYLRAYLQTNTPLYKRIVLSLVRFLFQEMFLPSEGGFASSIDSDVNNQEGLFYLLNQDELDKLFSDEEKKQLATLFPGLFASTQNNPFLLSFFSQDKSHTSEELDTYFDKFNPFASKLYPFRLKRHSLCLDHKVIGAWNALALNSLLKVALSFNDEKMLQTVLKSIEYLWAQFSHDDNLDCRFIISHKKAGAPTLEDYAYWAKLFKTLHIFTQEQKFYQRLKNLQNAALDGFFDEKHQWFYLHPDTPKFCCVKELADGVMPNPAWEILQTLLYQDQHEKKDEYQSFVFTLLKNYAKYAAKNPTLNTGYYKCLAQANCPSMELLLKGDKKDSLYLAFVKSLCSLELNTIKASYQSSSNSEIHISYLKKKASFKDSKAFDAFFENLIMDEQIPTSTHLEEYPYTSKTSKLFLKDKAFYYQNQKSLPFIMSGFGLGMYRMGNDNKNKEIIKQASQIGINIFDSSSNYLEGDSEIVLGKAIAELKKEEKQSPFLVATKAGYIQGQNLKNLQSFNRHPSMEITKVTTSHWHSIDPQFLDSEINASTCRLGFKPLHLFYLHNPEHILHAQTEESFLKKIEHAFEYLEQQVKNKRLQFYGVSSNSFMEPKYRIPLVELIEIAKKVGGAKHHFRAIQFPLNLIESEAFTHKVHKGLNLIDYAKQEQISTFSNRPLDVYSHDRSWRLKESPTFTLSKEIDELEKKFAYLESVWKNGIAPHIRGLKDPDSLRTFFQYATIISQAQKNYACIEDYQALENELYNQIFERLEFLDTHLKIGKPQLWLSWKTDYLTVLQEYFVEGQQRVKEKAALFSKTIRACLDPFVKNDYQTLPLSVLALWILRHTRVDCILNGARKPPYLKELEKAQALPLKLPINNLFKELQQSKEAIFDKVVYENQDFQTT